MKISIVIPVHNGEKIVAKAIQSCVTQTYRDIEIVCVNDGSTDQTLPLLTGWQLQDDRVKIIDQTNLGVVKARENGVSTSTGDYIYFLDADDWLPAHAIQCLVAYAAGTDMVAGKYIGVKTRMHVTDKPTKPHWGKTYSGIDCLRYVLREAEDSIWNILIRKELFEHVTMDSRIRWSEDFVLKVQLSAHAQSLTIVECVTYFYYVNPTSVTISAPIDVFLTWRNAKAAVETFLEQQQLLAVVNNEWLLRSITWELRQLFTGLRRFNYVKSPLRNLIWKQLILQPKRGWIVFKNCKMMWKCALLVSAVSPVCAARIMDFYATHCVRKTKRPI